MCSPSTVAVDLITENESGNYNHAPYRFRAYGNYNREVNSTISTSPYSGREAWSPMTLSRIGLTVLLRIGFLLVQIGSVPVTNINLIMLQNIVDFSWITLVWLLAGYAIAYNGDVAGLVGQGRWIGSETGTIDEEAILVGWQAAVVASAIGTCFLVGRTHIVGYLVIGTLVTGVLQPLAIHWAWTPDGWMAQRQFLGSYVAFRDFAGSSLVHTLGSVVGLIGCLVLGRRILRLRDIDDASIPADSAGVALAGYFLVLLGLQSMCFSSPSESGGVKMTRNVAAKKITMIIVNNLLGGASCSLAVVALHFTLGREPFNHWTVMRCVQASIAGATILSAGVNFYNPPMCLGLGFAAGIVHYLASRRSLHSALEDYCNIVATHLVCSVLGTIVAPFGHATHNPGTKARDTLAGFAWQIICLFTIVCLVALPVAIAFGILDRLGLLRNRSEIVNHSRALVALEMGPPRSFMQRLFLPDGEPLYLQPCTARVRRRPDDEVIPRLSGRARPAVKFETGASGGGVESPRGARKTTDTAVSVAKSNVSARSSRVKKFRQIHTLGSISEIAVCETSRIDEAMGDDPLAEEKNEKREFVTSCIPKIFPVKTQRNIANPTHCAEPESPQICASGPSVRTILARNFSFDQAHIFSQAPSPKVMKKFMKKLEKNA